ncbi:MAG: hypothetical protein KC776_41815 [Myxococcales bacterium]|nr:hypothetical protein [Myxococcales bacterium]
MSAQVIPFPIWRVRRRPHRHVELVTEEASATPRVLYLSAGLTLAIALCLQLFAG